MDNEDLICESCDSEFSVSHYEDDQVKYCPFCGNGLFSDEDNSDGYVWGADDLEEDDE